MNNYLVFLPLFLLVGCLGFTKIDATSEESYRESTKKIMIGLKPENQVRFVKATGDIAEEVAREAMKESSDKLN